MDDLCPQCHRPMYESGMGYHGVCRGCLTQDQRDDLDDSLRQLPTPPKYVFIYDAYVRISAHSKEEADRKVALVESTVDGMRHSLLELFDAYGVEISDTGVELRQVH
jgi:hypothetical protein